MCMYDVLNQRSPSSCHLILSSCSPFVGRPHTSLVLCFGPLLKHSCNVRSARSVSFSGSFWIRRYGPPHLLVAPSPPVICGISSGLLVPIMVGWMSTGYPVLVGKTVLYGWRWTALLPLAEPEISLGISNLSLHKRWDKMCKVIDVFCPFSWVICKCIHLKSVQLWASYVLID